jgi:exopolysaccharide biosynthesis WecB/TagA/CpsF family protein
MRDEGRSHVLGIGVDVCDYEGAAARILTAARDGRPLAASALAVHGVMTGVGKANREHRWRLNHLDLVTPDGQPVRWALNRLFGAGLRDRVYGPVLMACVLEAAAAEGLAVYFYGSRPDVVSALAQRCRERWQGLVVAGALPSAFTRGSGADVDDLAGRIQSSGARVVFLGIGCPRQEVLAYELRSRLRVPVVAVGAAFDYHAGLLREPPEWVQRAGLQWLYRLAQDPRRLWERYLVLGPAFVALVAAQRLGRQYDRVGVAPGPGATIDL